MNKTFSIPTMAAVRMMPQAKFTRCYETGLPTLHKDSEGNWFRLQLEKYGNGDRKYIDSRFTLTEVRA